MSARQVRRLLARYRERGPAGLASGHRGKASNNAVAAAVRRVAMDLVRDRYADFGPTFAHEKLARERSWSRRTGIAKRLEIHCTPKHGSWLNMAESGVGAMVRQCLDRRIPDRDSTRRETDAWQQRRNRESLRVDWRFTTADARIKLKSLYPSMQM